MARPSSRIDIQAATRRARTRAAIRCGSRPGHGRIRRRGLTLYFVRVFVSHSYFDTRLKWIRLFGKKTA